MKKNILAWYTWACLLIKKHKAASIIVALLIIGIGYYGYTKVSAQETTTRYVLGQVERGTLISSISGTGQVAATNQVDVKPKVSGQITSVNVSVGQQVKEGDIIARIDNTDAAKSLTKAQQSLAAAQISYQKAIQQSQLSQTDTVQSVADAQLALTNAYQNAYTTVSNVYIDIPSIILGMDAIYYNPTHSPYFSDQQVRAFAGETAITYKYQAGVIYDQAKNEFTTDFNAYKAASSTSDPQTLINLIKQAQSITTKMQNALTGAYNTIDFINLRISNPKPSEIATDETAVSSYRSKITSDVTSLADALKAIQDAQANLQKSQTTLSNSQTSLNGVDTLDIQSAKLSLAMQQTAYRDAADVLADYIVRAPFDGVVASVSAKKGDTASSGTALATVITQQKVATISLNEIDVAKIKTGEKATLTFDAVSGLTISGEVLEVDSIGTVTQGVVNYKVQIGFDTQDDRIKPGMSVSASIITESKPDVLLIPTSAIKTNANGSYVEVLNTVSTSQTQNVQAGIVSATPPQQVPVEIGSSNDSQTEITSGLNEGDSIVTRTITSTAKTPTTGSTQRANTGVLGVPTGGGARAGFTGGNFRVQ